MISECLTALINTVRRSFSFPKPTGSAECVSTCTEEGRHIKWWIMSSAINGTGALNETLSKMDEGRRGNISTKDKYLLASHSCSSGCIWICFLSINKCLVRAIVKSECLGKEELKRRQESYCWKTAVPYRPDRHLCLRGLSGVYFTVERFATQSVPRVDSEGIPFFHFNMSEQE